MELFFSTKSTSRLHQFGTKMLPGIFIEYELNSGGGWTEDFIIADWHDIENNVASEVHLQRFKSKEVEIARSIIYFLCRWFFKTRRVTHNVTLHATRESGASTRRKYPLRWVRRGYTLCRAHGCNSWQEEGDVADF